jgi:hypothetical protein
MSALVRQQNQIRANQQTIPMRTPRPDSQAAPADDRLLAGQRTLGNQAMQRLLRSDVIRAKLAVNKPGDRYEQEADRVAETVQPPSAVGRCATTSSSKRRQASVI